MKLAASGRSRLIVTDIAAPGTTSSSPREDLGQRYWRAALDSVLRGGGSLVIGGLVPMLLARFLGPHDFGIYAIITGLTALVASLFHMGQNSALHKLLPQYYVSDRVRGGAILANVLTLTFVVAAIVCLSFLAGAPLVAAKIYHDPTLTNFFRFCAVLIFVLTLLNLASSVAAGVQDFKAYNSAMLVRSLLLIVLACIGASLWGLWGALASQLLAGGVSLLWLVRRVANTARERFPHLIRPDFSGASWRVIAAFMLPAFVITLLNAPCYWWANTLVARVHGFAQAGLFSAAYGLAQLISLAPFNFYVPALTFLTEAHASEEQERFNELVRRSLRGIWFLTLPIALGCALFSSVLIELFYGGKYLAAAPAAFLMSLAGLFMAIVGLLNAILAAAGKIWSGCAITLGWAIIFASGAGLLIPRWGAIGAAITFGVSYVLYFFLLGGYLHFFLGVKLHTMRRPALLTVGSYLLAMILPAVFSGLALFLAALILLALITLVGVFWVCDETERRACETGIARCKQLAWGWK